MSTEGDADKECLLEKKENWEKTRGRREEGGMEIDTLLGKLVDRKVEEGKERPMCHLGRADDVKKDGEKIGEDKMVYKSSLVIESTLNLFSEILTWNDIQLQ